MTEREMLLKKIGTCKFAVTDIDLFLNTHPGDEKMLQKREEYAEQLKPLIKEFEDKFGPLTKAETGNTWSWVKDPWPWDLEG
ncbi:MAG: spore coat protein CotJB [Ruminococcus sp.]|nr:spore coat protein CotJB [Ruminococcus sp.]